MDMENILKELQNINNRLLKIEKNQKNIEEKLNILQKSVNGIENDIYEDDYEFEIICPYCNTEFVADITSKTNIQCPECNNIIELDWNADDTNEILECTGSCSRCSSKCGDSWFQDIEEIEEDDEYNEYNKYKNNEDDD